MINEIPKQALIIAAAAVLFIGFLGVRGLVSGAQNATTPTQEYYDDLARALQETGLLPQGTYDSVLISAAKVVAPDERFGDMWDTGSGVQEYYLGPVLTFWAKDGIARDLQLNVRHWQKLPTGPVREALRPFSKLGLVRQQGGARQGRQSLGGPAPSFYFISRLGVHNFQFTPHFDGDECVAIKVRLE